MSNENGSNSFMAFIVGGLLVAVGVLGYFAYTGDAPFAEDEASITIEMPEVDVDPGNG